MSGKSKLGNRFDAKAISIAIVKDNRDVDKTGILKVSIVGQTSNSEHEPNWKYVRYASPFWGNTPDNPKSNNFEDTKKSYGMWMVPPDIGNRVLVCFVNGDLDKGYWFACLPEGTLNHMVPGVGSATISGEGRPSTEYNNTRKDNTGAYVGTTYEPLYQGLLNQGLEDDLIRGQTSSTSKREAPSRSYGILTPRGHQIVFDDGWRNEELPWGTKNPDGTKSMVDPSGERGAFKTNFSSGDKGKPIPNPANQKSETKGSQTTDNPLGRNDEFIRFRTRSGAQVLISETDGHIYTISRDGNTWIELNNDGHIDIYGNESISIRAEKDVNIRADRDINFEAGRNINGKATGEHAAHATEGTGNIQIESNKSTDWTVGENYKLNVTGTHDSKSGGNMTLETGSNFGQKAGGSMFHTSQGSNNTNAGGDIIETGANIHMNGPIAKSSSSAAIATPPTTKPFTELVSGAKPASTYRGDDKTAPTSEATIDSIVTRRPHHEPWPAAAPTGDECSARDDGTVANFLDKK